MTEESNIQKEDIKNVVEQQQENAVVETEKQERDEDINWRNFREARKKDRAEKEAALKRAAEKEAEIAALKEALNAAVSRDPPRESTPYFYDQEETEEQRIEKKVQQILEAREMAAERERREREQKEYPTKLTASFPDFNAVVTADNLDYLEYHYPEIARPFQRLPDNFDKWSDVYYAVKKLVPNASSAKREAAKVDANALKPRSPSSAGMSQSPTSPPANNLTEERKAANWARMRSLMNSI